MKFAPAFYQGEAYLANKQFDLAARSFERILQNRSIAPDSAYIGLAAMQLGRALQLQGDPQGAARAFQDAGTCWAEADANFLPLQLHNRYQLALARVH